MLLKHWKLTCVVGLVAVIQSAFGQIIVNTSTYSQNFNTLSSGSTGAYVWNQSTTLTGWQAFHKPNSTLAWTEVTEYKSNSGTAMNYGLYSLGGDSADRGLGARPHSGEIGAHMYGTGFQNNLGSTITSVTISFRAEVWWKAAVTSTQSLEFQYNADESGVNAGAGWITSQDLTFSWANVAGGGTGHVDGNSVGGLMSATISGLSIEQGQELWLRWMDIDDMGAEYGMGIDDFSISFQTASGDPVPEPATIALAASAAALAIRRRRKSSKQLPTL